MSAQAVTKIWEALSPDIWKFTITWTCTDGGVVSSAFTEEEKARVLGKYLFFMVTNPSATAPTDNYNITLVDDDSIDMAGGVLLLRDTSNSEEAIPLLVSGASGDRIVNGGLTVTIADAGNAKIGTLKLWFRS